ncbi:hypothetical protein [Kitasatospora sp. NPDC056531]|uniref:hypothetical protein n=1 Tax=Kitasatospora sp. NPDC056531 TaxID=3345856 RepID=UPI0036B957BE
MWLRILHFLNLLFMLFIIRAGIQILADHPRLRTDAGCMPGRERLRLRGPVPPDQSRPASWRRSDDASPIGDLAAVTEVIATSCHHLVLRTDEQAMASLAAPIGGQQWTPAADVFARLRSGGGDQ